MSASIKDFGQRNIGIDLFRALTMPAEERADRAAMLRRVVEANSVEKWVQAQFADIGAKLAADGP